MDEVIVRIRDSLSHARDNFTAVSVSSKDRRHLSLQRIYLFSGFAKETEQLVHRATAICNVM
jgi:hypothetical protein